MKGTEMGLRDEAHNAIDEMGICLDNLRRDNAKQHIMLDKMQPVVETARKIGDEFYREGGYIVIPEAILDELLCALRDLKT
jgi:hypothetical protein